MTYTIRQCLIEAGILGEHQPRAADLWHVPADALIEAGSAVKHAVHVTDLRRVPATMP